MESDKYIVIIRRGINGRMEGVYSRAFKVIKKTKTGYQFEGNGYKENGQHDSFSHNWAKSGVRHTAKREYGFRGVTSDHKYYVEDDTVLCLSHSEALPESVAVFLAKIRAFKDAEHKYDRAREAAEKKFEAEKEAARIAYKLAVDAYDANVNAECEPARDARSAALEAMWKCKGEMANGLVWR